MMATTTKNWWETGNTNTAQQNLMQNQAAGVDTSVLNQLGINTGNSQPSWSDSLNTYVAPPSQALQNTVYALSHSGATGTNQFQVTKYGGPEGGYVYTDTLPATATWGPQTRQIWINDKGQQFNMVDGKVPDIAKIGNNSTQFVGTPTGQYSVNQTAGGTFQTPQQAAGTISNGPIGYTGGASGSSGTYGSQYSALNNLDAMMSNPLFAQQQNSLSQSLSQGPITDQLRESFRTSAAERNASLRDQQMKALQNKAGSAGVGRQDMSNSSVASLNSSLAAAQGQADRDAAQMQAEMNQSAKESAQGKTNDFLSNLRQWSADLMQNDAQREIAQSGNLWSWLLSRMGG